MEIRVSAKAMRNRRHLLDYIEDKHSLAISDRVDTRIEAVIADLPNLPFKWPAEYTPKLGQVRKATVDELSLVFYRVQDTYIEIVDITDARSNWQ